ncbi:MAG: PaaI family thioesterase [Hyphomicrobiaceae bacterium]
MTGFEPRDATYRARIESSFAQQAFLDFMGAELRRVAPGAVDIALPFKCALAQQHGHVHGGAITSIADTAAGYAAMTLSSPGVGVLTTELKVNFLRPAGPGVLCAAARVIKPGRTLNIVQVDVTESRSDEEVHVLTGLVTIMFVDGID